MTKIRIFFSFLTNHRARLFGWLRSGTKMSSALVTTSVSLLKNTWKLSSVKMQIKGKMRHVDIENVKLLLFFLQNTCIGHLPRCNSIVLLGIISRQALSHQCSFGGKTNAHKNQSSWTIWANFFFMTTNLDTRNSFINIFFISRYAQTQYST